MLRSLRPILAATALALLAGCSTSAVPDTSAHESVSSAGAEVVDDGWQEYLLDPGTPGVDYDPQSITVGYRRDAVLPAGLIGAPPKGQRAADQSNPMLRENTQFETVTDAIASRYGLSIDQQVYLRKLNFASFTLEDGVDGSSVIASIRRDFTAQIEYAAYSPLIHPCYDPNDTYYGQSTETTGPQWSLKKCNFDDAWDYTTGVASEMIAIVDTGCRLTHQDLAGQVLDPEVAFPSATCDIANDDKTIEDNEGHGTALCGLAAAQMDDAFGMTGGAPGCRVIPIKMSEDGGGVTHAHFVAGCMLGFTLGARAVNLSWRSTGGSPQLQGMVEDIFNGGGLLFVSAGNDANDDMTYPASYTNAIAVGNTWPDDIRSGSSTYGEWVDIAAPGEDLISTGNHEDDDYHQLTPGGTSMSAPLVAAAAALLWSYKPDLTNAEVRDLLLDNAGVATGFNTANSLPRLDIGAALDALGPIVVPATFDSLDLTADICGHVPGLTSIAPQVTNAQNVDRIVYTLDCAPVGTLGLEDITLQSVATPFFGAQLLLPSPPVQNQLAELRAQCYNADNDPGTLMTLPVYIFNQRGDVNLDGLVDAADLAAYTGRTGLHDYDPAYVPFYDTDLDGLITEADAGAIGYYWSL